jgi:sugar phosphate isomerase/epimerase
MMDSGGASRGGQVEAKWRTVKCIAADGATSFFRLRDAVGPTVGVNFDPSHLMWMGGDAVSAIKRLGSECIYHVHGKDTYIEAQAKVDGLIDPKPVTPVKGRAWNYVSLGHGNSFRSWLDILSTLNDVGYGDVISIENEDYSLDADTAISTSTSVLRFCIEALSGAGCAQLKHRRERIAGSLSGEPTRPREPLDGRSAVFRELSASRPGSEKQGS